MDVFVKGFVAFCTTKLHEGGRIHTFHVCR